MLHIQAKSALAAVSLALLVVSTAAQTPVVVPKNRYSPAEDVTIGQDAAQKIRQELPVLRDAPINSYLGDIGRRLVENIPPEFRHPEFRYSFTGVNLRDINAFALPGGPMFVNRGMIEKAHNEGEIAGVMAHELSHVALRHGTAQQTAAMPYAIGSVAGQILGAIVGGTKGQIIAQGSQFGIGTYFLKFSREYEQQADILGSHIMASAGYDPRDMANVFKTIERESGPGGPQFLSDHPNPGNRYDYINKEAQMLRVANARRDSTQFQSAQAHLRTLPAAPSMEEVARNASAGRDTGGGASDVYPSATNVPRPDTHVQTYNEGDLFRVSVPSNWRELSSNNSVTFAPEGAYGTSRGQSVFTHGVEIGVGRNENHDLRTATDELVQALREGNSELMAPPSYERGTISGRQGLHARLTNVSEVTGGQEIVDLYTTLLPDGSLFYILGVAPREEFNAYANAIRNVVGSIQFQG